MEKFTFMGPILASILAFTPLSAGTIEEELHSANVVHQENPNFLNNILTPANSFGEHLRLFKKDVEYFIDTLGNYLETHKRGEEGSLSFALHDFFTETRARSIDFFVRFQETFNDPSFNISEISEYLEKEYTTLFTMTTFSKGIVKSALEHIKALENSEEVQKDLKGFFKELLMKTDPMEQAQLFQTLQGKIDVLQEPAVASGYQLPVLESEKYNHIPESGVVVVDYYANWCGPCRKMLPKFQTVAGELNGEAQFYKCEATEEVFKGLEIRTIPCIILYKDGKEVKRTGSLSKEQLTEWITSEL